jgi:hypothetical protein
LDSFKSQKIYFEKAIELNIDISKYDKMEDFYRAVNDMAIEKYIEEYYPDGAEVNIKCCDECSTWIVGEHRCSCGNRRMYLESDGDIVNGLYVYPAAG